MSESVITVSASVISENATMSHESTSISLYRGSLNYFTASDIIINSNVKCPSDSFGFLISHSLELSLKAYLLSTNIDETKIKKIGHSLIKAWNKCFQNGLGIEKEVPQWVVLLDAGHSNDFLFRYSKTNTGIVTASKEVQHHSLSNIIDIVGENLNLDRNGNVKT